eukprot:CAMPEP_0168273078 /NCGR_PEP_ID=MMETSP0141_2-20121125/16555_1 /TAXON_ID=44445 /ORGANISM="Pseudo-nitzschia australis, Strain 10249 10 AB" /LENGTH=647 /DNA_ID=CAMNT_0008214539 /DNA_START=390 /DNA_END=2333 /DNA_ORIENTATION=+
MDRRFHGHGLNHRFFIAVAATAVLCSTSFGKLPGVSSLSFNSGPVFSSKAMNNINNINNDNINNNNKQATTTAAGNELPSWPATAGDAALRQVQFLAATVSESTETSVETNTGDSMLGTLKSRFLGRTRDRIKPVPGNDSDGSAGINGSNTISNTNSDALGRKLLASSPPSTNNGVFDNQNNRVISSSSKRNDQVWAALSNLEQDMQLLDNLAGQRPQLTALELIMLSASVTAASSSPWIMGGQLTEVLPPTAAAFSAAIGIGAEYVGRVAVADGKEVAAATICCASEAEGFLANSERAKAIMPLCVGVSATATTLSLLVPVLLTNTPSAVSMMNEFYLACPLISVLSAAVAALALQDTKVFCNQATSVGNRRFAKSGLVGRTWKSTGQQITNKTVIYRIKWRSFIFSVLPAPILGALVPGAALATKSVIVTAIAAAQVAYTLAEAEYCLARATDAVAIKARSAAVCDTYANQGARSAAILPFTSALSGLCAAATAAIVELPFLETLSASGTVVSLTGEMAIVGVLPLCSTLFAAAASVSKARCEVDAEAAVQAASTLALEYGDKDDDDPILRPFRGVAELIRLVSVSTLDSYQRIYRRVRVSILTKFKGVFRFLSFRTRRRGGSGGSSKGNDINSDGSAGVVPATA